MDDKVIDEEVEAYEAAARKVAEKVQRQQEGIESSMLNDEHKDETYLTVDEIQKLLDDQRAAMASGSGNGSRFSLFSSSFSGGNMRAEEAAAIGDWYVERSKYIPLRLDYKERPRLRLIESIMKCCDYTDRVDDRDHKSNTRRQHMIQCSIRAVLVSIATSFKFDLAQKLVQDMDFSKYKTTFCKVFEIGRRYKVMNPEKMRSTYGKMIHLLQDAMTPEIVQDLEFVLVKPMHTVYSTLENAGILECLKSEYISTATMEILPDGKSRQQIQREIKLKEHAIDFISKKYANEKLGPDQIKNCLYSIGDNSSYLNSNCKPIDYMISMLKTHFGGEDVAASKWGLAIYGGEDGSRLTHSHERQYHYVLQSLTLWREIIHDMFRLWYVAEQDLLDPESRYKLKNTGQGVHRLQQAPRTSKTMHGILYAVQQRLGNVSWIGSSVIHISDTNVPNALFFIDKYNQVPRILNPIVRVLKYISDTLVKDPALVRILEAKYGGVEETIKTILHDFFRKAFDGSGGDNWFVAGSCTDGRLSSAWNWCQSLPDKDYYFLFKLSGFSSFDGEFKA